MVVMEVWGGLTWAPAEEEGRGVQEHAALKDAERRPLLVATETTGADAAAVEGASLSHEHLGG